MPLPLAPLVPVALRLGLAAGTAWAVRRALVARTHPGRTDQRAEDAFDDLDEGLAVHRPADRATEGATQTNAAARVLRRIRFGGRTIEIDAALMGRFRVTKS